MTRIFIIERSNQQYRAAFTQLQAKQDGSAAVVCIASRTLNRRMTRLSAKLTVVIQKYFHKNCACAQKINIL
jgi:hypothetical protein